MRIGIIVAQFPSYSETFFVTKVIGLCQRGHEVIVFCSMKHTDIILEEIYGLKTQKNLKIIDFNFTRSLSTIIKTIISHPLTVIKSFSFHIPDFKKKIYRNLCLYNFKKEACDIYHFGYSGIALYYMSLFDQLNGKIMVSCLGSAEKVKPLSEDGRKEKLRLLFKRVDKIHCVSNDMALTIKQYNSCENKIYINRPAVSIQFFHRKNEYLDKKKDTIQILSIGRLVFQKGFLIGLLAVHDLKKQFLNFKWKIAGEGPEREELIAHIHILGLTEYVELLGKKTRDEVLDLYEASDIFFLPSVYEGIANVALESMSMKLPVVSSINGGMNEAITHNINGMLSENYNHASMSENLFHLCTNFEKRKRLGEYARKTIEEKFSLERYINVFEEEYYKLIQQ